MNQNLIGKRILIVDDHADNRLMLKSLLEQFFAFIGLFGGSLGGLFLLGMFTKRATGRGAFTGAVSSRAGRFELADGGTLFLDEIGDMSLKTQAKVLRVLQDGEVEPVGAGRTFRVDVRVIAATNRNLRNMIDEGKFRPDLFYRLHVVPVKIPPLRERRDDILPIARHYAAVYAKKYGKSVRTFSLPAETARAFFWSKTTRRSR